MGRADRGRERYGAINERAKGRKSRHESETEADKGKTKRHEKWNTLQHSTHLDLLRECVSLGGVSKTEKNKTIIRPDDNLAWCFVLERCAVPTCIISSQGQSVLFLFSQHQ